MISTKDEKVFWILDLVRKKQANCFEGLLASVNVVTQEEIIGFRWKSPIFEEAEQIIVLSMDIAANLEG